MDLYDYFENKLPERLSALPLGKELYVGIYGMGLHTKCLLQWYQSYVGPIEARLIFIDSKKRSLSEQYDGRDIYNVRDIGELPLDAVILSSSLYEDEMLRTIRNLYGDRFRIYRFYEHDKQDIFYGLYTENAISELRTIKINFVDFWLDFDVYNNFISAMLFRKYRLVISEEPDLLFCSHFGNKYREYKNCIKIFVATEVRPFDFHGVDYALGYQYMEDKRFLHYSIYAPRNAVAATIQDRTAFSDFSLVRRRFCNFIYFNEMHGEGAYVRKDFCMALNKYKHVDCPGRVLNNMEDAIEPRESAEWWKGKLPFIGRYKFTIAFENHRVDGYTTEKLWDPFMAGSIPIYWGNPQIHQEVHSQSFINCNDYDNDFDAVIEKIREADNDDEYYMYMLRKSPLKKSYDLDNEALKEFLEKIISEKNL